MSTIDNWTIDESRPPHEGFPHPCVKVIARIRENATGIIREVPESLAFGVDGDSPFIYGWAEGNFSCDCNRKLSWGRTGGIEFAHDETPCGGEAFSVQLVNPKNGEAFYDEFEDRDLQGRQG